MSAITPFRMKYASRPAPALPKTVPKMGEKKALLVGINYTSHPQIKLNGCINDIVNIGDVLSQRFHYEKANIKELRDDSRDPRVLPTRANILQNLIQLVNESANLSEIWFHYSGHGSQVFDITSKIKEGLEEVIVPVDYERAGFIIDNEIFNILQNAKCKVILIFDCCHSGTVCDLQWSFEYKDGKLIKYQIDDKEIANPNIFCFSGCKDSQTSADAYNPQEKRSFGAFTDAFLHCLKDNQYNVSILKLYGDICNRIKAEGYEQRPNLSSSSTSPNYIFSENVMLNHAASFRPILEGGWATADNRDIPLAPSAPEEAPLATVQFSIMKPTGPITPMSILSVIQHIDVKPDMKKAKTEINNLKNQATNFFFGKKR